MYLGTLRLIPWQASCIWGMLLGAALILRYLFDTLAPPADYSMRASLLTYAIMGTALLSGSTTATRTRSMLSGTLTAVSAAAIGALLSIIGTGFMLAIWHDPAVMDAWQRSGGLDEAFVDVPLKVVVIGGVLGTAGAVLGKVTALLRG